MRVAGVSGTEPRRNEINININIPSVAVDSAGVSTQPVPLAEFSSSGSDALFLLFSFQNMSAAGKRKKVRSGRPRTHEQAEAVRRANNSALEGASIPDGLLLDLLLAFAPPVQQKLVRQIQICKIANRNSLAKKEQPVHKI